MNTDWTVYMGLTVVDWAVLIVYLVGITVLGIFAYLKVSDMTDFFMGGRRFGKIFMMFFAFGAGTSSDQATTVVAGTWRTGLSGIWWQFLWLWATPFYWIVAPLMRRMRALTTSDFFEARYGKSTAGLYAAYGILISMVFISSALYGSGKMANALTGGELDRIAETETMQSFKIVPRMKTTVAPEDATPEEKKEFKGEKYLAWTPLSGYEIAILLITVLFVAYGMAGGLGAAIWTDFVQGILTIVLSFLLLPCIYYKIGGFSALKENLHLKDGMLELFGATELATKMGLEPITVFYVIVLSVTALCGIVVQPHIMGVCGAGKTEFEGRWGFTVGNFIKRFCTIAWTFTALGALVWYLGDTSPLSAQNSNDPNDQVLLQQLRDRANHERFDQLSKEEQGVADKTDQKFADPLFGRAAYDILPGVAPGLVGLLLASLLAAMMSTCDAQMIVGSGLFTENIYRRFFMPDKSQKHYLWVGRFAALAIVLIALVISTTFENVVDALKMVIKTPAAIGISLWIGICWRRWTTAAVWVSSLSAYAAWFFISQYDVEIVKQWGDYLPEWMTYTNAKGVEVLSDALVNVCYLSAGVISGLIVSFVTPQESQGKLDHFFRLMRTPVKAGEEVKEPCTLPEDAGEPIGKLINHPDIEIPAPDRVDIIGFALSWVGVGLIVGLVYWLANM